MKNLSETELLILNWIWDNKKAVPLKEIKEYFLKEKGITGSSVSTYLTRLINKGYLKSEKFLQTTLYTPIILKRDFVAKKAKDILNELYGNNAFEFVLDFIKATEFTAEQKESIIKALKENR